jgi:hypothetical protein
MSRFQYAPGLPGYGTQGADGSNGLLGISLYFSELDGETQTASIRSRIDNSELLTTASGTNLPGYPTRVYQNGDIFIDTNGKVYEIDLGLINKYAATGERLNTSTIFVQGLDSSTDPTFTRYHNAYTTEKFLLDNVYSVEGVSNYTQSPDEIDGIYGLPALNFGQVKYVDISLNSYLPYTIWNNTINTAEPEKAIALVKEYDSETWRWGNVDNIGNIRDVSLILDFNKVISSGNIEVNGGTLTFTSDSSGILTVIEGYGLEIITPNSSSTSIAAKDILIQTGSGADGTTDRGNPGDIKIAAGKSGNSSNGTVQREGGIVNILSGDAGSATFPGSATDYYGSDAGDINVTGGVGGDINISVTSGADVYGGVGGDINITSGIGGDASTSYEAYGGNGGNLWMQGGDGGDAYASYAGQGGRGGYVYIRGGDGQSGSGAFSSSGGAGWVYIDSGLSGISGRVSIQTLSGDGTYIGGVLYTLSEIWANQGSYGNPSITFSGDTNVGFYRPQIDTLGISLGSQQLWILEGSDGVYINPRDCSIVIQPSIESGSSFPNGLGIELVTRVDTVNGGNGGRLRLATNSGAIGGDGGDIKIEAGNGSGSGEGGSITISPGTGNINGDLILDPAPVISGGGLFINNLTNNTSAVYHLATVGTSGPFYIDNTTPGSDIRIKNIQKELNGDDIIKAFKNLTGIYWKYNEHSKKVYQGGSDTSTMHIGLIAQELQPYFPELVSTFTGDDGEEYFGIDYEMFAPLFVEVFKEHQSQIEDLRSIIDKQQEQIDKLLELNNLK